MKRIALITCLALAAPFALAQTSQEEDDKGFITSFIEKRLSNVTRDVTIEGFDGALSSEARIARLAVSDRDGEWLVMEDVVLDWSRAALLRLVVDVDQLSARRIAILRKPVPDPSAPVAEPQPFSLPKLPVSIDIGELLAERIELGPDFLGEPIAAEVYGDLALNDGTLDAALNAFRLDDKQGQFIVDADYSQDTRELALTLIADEGPDGIAARMLNLPGKPAMRLSVEGTGPIDDYTADIALETDGEPRLSGQVGVRSNPAADPVQMVQLDLGGDLRPLLEPAYHSFFGQDSQLLVDAARFKSGETVLRNLAITSQAMELLGTARLGPNGWPQDFSLKGRIGGGGDGDTLLPIPGDKVTLSELTIDLLYNAATGEAWEGAFTLKDLHRKGLTVPLGQITAGGIIRQPADGVQGEWTANVDMGADDISFSDDRVADAVGDRVTGRVELTGAQQSPTQMPVLRLDGAGLALAAEGQMKGPDSRLDTHVSATLTAQDLSRFAAMTGRDLKGAVELNADLTARLLDRAVRLALEGSTQDVTVGSDLIDPLIAGAGDLALTAARDENGTRLPRFSITTPHAAITANADIQAERAEAALTARIPDASVLDPQLSGPAVIDAKADRGADDIARLGVDIALPETTARVDGTVLPASAGFASDLTLTAKLGDLAPYSGIAGRDLDGAATLRLNGHALPDTGAFDLDLHAETADLALGQDHLDALLTGAGELTARLGRTNDGRLSVDRLHLQTDQLRTDGSGRLAGGSATADFDAAIRDTAVLSPDLSGPLRLTGTAKQTAEGATGVDVKAIGPGLDLDLDATVAAPSEKLRTRYDLTATLEDLSRYASIIGREIQGSASGRITGTALPRSGVGEATVDASLRGLALSIPAADRLLRGAGTIKGKFERGEDGALSVTGLDVQMPRVTATGDASLAKGDVFADLSARLTDVSDLLPGLPGPARMTLTSAASGDGHTDLKLDASGPAGITLAATAQVADDDPDLTTAFDATLALPRLSALRQVVGQPLSGRVDLTAKGAARPLKSSGTVTISATTQSLGIGQEIADAILSGTGRLTANARRDDDGTIVLSDADLRLPQLTATASGSLKQQRLAGSFNGRLADLSVLSSTLSGALDARGTLRRQGSQTAVDVTADGPGGMTLAAKGALLDDGRMDMGLTGALPLALANRSISPQALDGTAQLDLRINGRPAIETVAGTISTSGARFSEPRSGQALQNITGSARLTGGRLMLDMTGEPVAGGRLSVTGPVDLTGRMAADLRITADDLTLRDPQLYETTADGTVTVTGPLRGAGTRANIAGQITLGETEVRVPSSGVGGLGTLPEIRHINTPAPVRRTLKRAGLSIAGVDLRRGGEQTTGRGASAEPEFPLDLTISAPARIFIRGRGLDAELGGSLRIGGTSENVIPSGRFELIRGRIDILQQRFKLTEGYVTMEGDFSPYIRLVATTDTKDGTASIILEGDAAEPEINFSSIPELPEDEVLSRLIFGRSLKSITPFQAVQLAAAVNTLAGRGNGGLVGRLRDGVGLDDLDVTSDDQGNTAVRAGKYLSENIYTEVEAKSDGTSRIDLNLDVTDTVTLKGGTSSDGNSRVGIFFEKDY